MTGPDLDRLDHEWRCAQYATEDAERALDAMRTGRRWPSEDAYRARLARWERRVERARTVEREAEAAYTVALAVAERLEVSGPGWIPEFPMDAEWQDRRDEEFEARYERADR